MLFNLFPSSGLGTPVLQSSALLLAKQSFAEVRSQTEFGNEVHDGSLQTAKQLLKVLKFCFLRKFRTSRENHGTHERDGKGRTARKHRAGGLTAVSAPIRETRGRNLWSKGNHGWAPMGTNCSSRRAGATLLLGDRGICPHRQRTNLAGLPSVPWFLLSGFRVWLRLSRAGRDRDIRAAWSPEVQLRQPFRRRLVRGLEKRSSLQ